jgi:hypothetical protein
MKRAECSCVLRAIVPAAVVLLVTAGPALAQRAGCQHGGTNQTRLNTLSTPQMTSLQTGLQNALQQLTTLASSGTLTSAQLQAVTAQEAAIQNALQQLAAVPAVTSQRTAVQNSLQQLVALQAATAPSRLNTLSTRQLTALETRLQNRLDRLTTLASSGTLTSAQLQAVTAQQAAIENALQQVAAVLAQR